jgi:hypothetical protein
MDDERSNREPIMPMTESLAVRANAQIAKAEIEFEAAKSGLEMATAAAAQARKDYEELRRLTAPFKTLAPLIRDEVNALGRFWHQSEERRGKLTELLDAANKELKSVYLAREQLKKIGIYIASAGALPIKLSVVAAPLAATDEHAAAE